MRLKIRVSLVRFRLWAPLFFSVIPYGIENKDEFEVTWSFAPFFVSHFVSHSIPRSGDSGGPLGWGALPPIIGRFGRKLLGIRCVGTTAGMPPEKWFYLRFGFRAIWMTQECPRRSTNRRRSSPSSGRLMFWYRKASLWPKPFGRSA